MRISKLLLLIIIFMGLGRLAWSQSDFDKVAYETSKALCNPLKEKGAMSQTFSYFHLYVLTSSLKETDSHLSKIVEGVFNPEKRALIQDYKTAGALGDLLHSEGFMQAMRECFPDESDHHRFVLTLILSEKIGNFVIMTASAVGVSLSIRYLVFKFPQLFSIQSLKFLVKTSILLSPLALASSTDKDSVQKQKRETIETQIRNLELKLKDTNLSPDERKNLNTQLRALILQKALEGL